MNSPNDNLYTQNFYNNLNNFFFNPSAFIILFLVFAVFLGFFLYLGNSTESNIYFTNDLNGSNGSNGKSNLSLVVVVLLIIFVILVIVNGLQYFLGINVVASLDNLFQGSPKINIKVVEPPVQLSNTVPEIPFIKQVFNIPEQQYTYEQAKALCQAYDGRLANFNEVEDAFKKGGSWCNMGWSEGQLALYPTSNDVYKQLQNIPGHSHDCGIPGVNGGYISNPRVKFGVNCFGYKPKITQEEEELMHVSPYPKTMKDILFEKQVDYYKTKVNDILVSPFNQNMWSKI
jgi:hypothetical protein